MARHPKSQPPKVQSPNTEFAMRPKPKFRPEISNLVSLSAAEELKSDSEEDHHSRPITRPVRGRIPSHIQKAQDDLNESTEEESENDSVDSVLPMISTEKSPRISDIASIPAGAEGPSLATVPQSRGVQTPGPRRSHDLPSKELHIQVEKADLATAVTVTEVAMRGLKARRSTPPKTRIVEKSRRKRRLSTTPLFPSGASPGKGRVREVRDIY